MTLIERIARLIRAVTLGRRLDHARRRHDDAAKRLDAAVREVLKK